MGNGRSVIAEIRDFNHSFARKKCRRSLNRIFKSDVIYAVDLTKGLNCIKAAMRRVLQDSKQCFRMLKSHARNEKVHDCRRIDPAVLSCAQGGENVGIVKGYIEKLKGKLAKNYFILEAFNFGHAFQKIDSLKNTFSNFIRENNFFSKKISDRTIDLLLLLHRYGTQNCESIKNINVYVKNHDGNNNKDCLLKHAANPSECFINNNIHLMCPMPGNITHADAPELQEHLKERGIWKNFREQSPSTQISFLEGQGCRDLSKLYSAITLLGK